MAVNQLSSVERLHRSAVETADLSEFGDPRYLEPLQVLLDSYRNDAGLTEQGVRRFEETLVGILVSKLRTQAAFREHPEYAATEVRRPVFVTGLPRTGTTALHRLLCVDPDVQGLEHWLADWPQPRPPRETWCHQPGYQATQRWLDELHAAIPGMNGVHYMSPEVVEECWRVERQSMLALAFASMAHLPSYSRWMVDQDLSPAYQIHRNVLALIGLGSPDRRWVLKSPAHLYGLDALMSVYPDALVVQTHRDPRTTIASVSSLNSRASAGTSTTYTPDVVGRDCLEIWSRGVRRFAESRRKYDTAQFLDVRYEDLVTDPVGVVEAIHTRFALPFDDARRAEVRRRDEESRTGERRPVHRYSLADFDLSEEEVVEAFGDYLAAHFDGARPA